MSELVVSEGRHPLKLSEIVANTMQYINNEGYPDAPTLFSCLQVNSLWFEEATTRLWSYTPPTQAITKASKNLDRCQYYANKIVALKFKGNECKIHPILLRMKFPRLKDFRVTGYDTAEEYHLIVQMLLQEAKNFRLPGGCIDDKILTQMEVSNRSSPDYARLANWSQAGCPLLTAISLSNRADQSTQRGLLLFLESAPSVTDLTLRFNHDTDNEPVGMSDNLFVHLAGRQHLQNLCIDSSVLTVDAIRIMLERVTQPFHQLPVLKCLAENEAFEQLVPHLSELKELYVTLLDQPSGAVSAIARCTSLTILAISLKDTHYWWYHEALLNVAEQCTQLRSLSFCTRATYEPATGPFQYVLDEHIKRLSANLPNLTTFVFDVHEWTRLTVDSLRHLGEACPRLEVCCLPDISDFRGLDILGPAILPQLKMLELDGDRLELPDWIIIDALSYHAPILEKLQLGRDSKFSAGIMKILQKRRALRACFFRGEVDGGEWMDECS